MKTAIRIWGVSFGIVLLTAMWAPTVSAYPTYSCDGTNNNGALCFDGEDGTFPDSGNCSNCHGDFLAANYVSLTSDDPAAWNNDMMHGHFGAYSLACSDCHTGNGNPRTPTFMDADDGGVTCVGCHGRNQDPDKADGLVAHHATAGIDECTDCHNLNQSPAGEDVAPPDFITKGVDPCDENGGGLGDGTGNFGTVGLDNDGDGMREPVDSDCSTNQAPNAIAGNDIAVADDDDDDIENVMLDAGGSQDPDGTIESYEWLVDNQVIANGANANVDFAVGRHEVLLRITDNGGLMATDTVTVIVFAKTVLDLVALPDVNGNSSTDVGALILDLSNPGYHVVLKDGADAADIRTLVFGEVNAFGAVAVPDANGNQTFEVAVLRSTFSGDIAADVYDTSDGTLVRSISFANAFEPVAFAAIDDIDGGGNPALVTLGINGNGDVRAQVKRVSNGALVRTVQFAPAFAPEFMVVVPDVTGNGIPELAVLGIDGAGNIRVQLKDASTGNLIHWIQFAKAFIPQGMVVIPDGPTGPAIAVLGVHADGRVSAQVKDASTRMPINVGRINFGRSFVFSHLAVVNDRSNNNVSELVYVGVDAGGTVRAQIKDPVTKQQIKLVFFASTFPPEDVESFSDISGNSIDELGVYGTNINNGNRRVQIKDSQTNAEVVLVPVP